VKTVAESPRQPNVVSVAAAKSYNNKRSLREWRILACLPKFIGRNFLFKRYKVSSIKGGPFMRTFGSSTVLASSATRAITNHAPTGEFRSSFFPHLNLLCNVCLCFQTRAHILDDCTCYTHKKRNFQMFLKNSSHPERYLFTWLSENRLAFTFAHAPL
jgi:hypothetical protein